MARAVPTRACELAVGGGMTLGDRRDYVLSEGGTMALRHRLYLGRGKNAGKLALNTGSRCRSLPEHQNRSRCPLSGRSLFALLSRVRSRGRPGAVVCAPLSRSRLQKNLPGGGGAIPEVPEPSGLSTRTTGALRGCCMPSIQHRTRQMWRR